MTELRGVRDAIEGFWTTTSEQAKFVPLDEILAQQHLDGQGLTGPLVLDSELDAIQAENEGF